MKIIFTSSKVHSPSFLFYASSLARINDCQNSVSIEISNNPNDINYLDYDVALFMSFHDMSGKAKKENPAIITGVVEPRASQKNTFAFADFIIVNSIESRDYFSRYSSKLMLYYTFPEVPPKMECPFEKNHLVLGYHGNLLNLEAMIPRITDAIEKLNKTTTVELWAMYNIEKLGIWKTPEYKNYGFKIEHIQYSVDNYAKFIAHVDIGLVPQFIPVRESKLQRYLLGSLSRKYNERFHNYFLRFKETTNLGRHLVFAQYKIPIICDMTPSSCSYIDDGNDGIIAFHSEGWYRGLKTLFSDDKLRINMGKALYTKYRKTATPDIQNEKLINFINSIIPTD